jgi:hypothetical protein
MDSKTYHIIAPQEKMLDENMMLKWALNALDYEEIPGPLCSSLDILALQLHRAGIIALATEEIVRLTPKPPVVPPPVAPPITIHRHRHVPPKIQQGIKRKNERHHAKERFLERYGIILSRPVRLALINDIQAGKYPMIEKQSNRVHVFEVILNERMMYVVYDKNRKEIVTVLYPNGETNGY